MITVVTGASSGMGLYAAVELAARGHTVIATMRDPARGDDLAAEAAARGVEVWIRKLDVTDEAECERFVAEAITELGGISVLVNNAGQGMVGTAEELTMAQIQDQLDVNYLGPVRLTRLVLPGMRANGSGRIVSVTSVGGAVGQPFADAYCGAKFALEGFMQSLAPVAAQVGVHVSVVEPAAVESKFVDNAVRPDAVEGPYGAQLQSYLNRTAGAFANAQSAEDAGRAIADAVTDEDPVFRYQTSDAAKTFVSTSLADLDGQKVVGFTSTWIS